MFTPERIINDYVESGVKPCFGQAVNRDGKMCAIANSYQVATCPVISGQKTYLSDTETRWAMKELHTDLEGVGAFTLGFDGMENTYLDYEIFYNLGRDCRKAVMEHFNIK